MHRSGRAVELVAVVLVLAVLVLLSLQSAGSRVQAALARAERQQAALDVAALEQARAVDEALGEQVVVAQVAGGLPETPAVRAGRALVRATSWQLPGSAAAGAAGALGLVLLARSVVRRRSRRRRRLALQRAVVAVSAVSPAAARCGPVDHRGTALLPVR